MRVKGHDTDGAAWEEMAATRDISAGGLSYPSTRLLQPGQIVQLSLPLPKSLREFDHYEPEYRVYGLIRGVTPEERTSLVHLRFFGKSPPRGYETNPGARFLLPWDAPATPPNGPGAPLPPPNNHSQQAQAPSQAVARRDPNDRRQARRHDVFVNLTVYQEDEWGTVLREELTVTENIGKGGARVMTALDFSRGEVVIVQEAGGGFATRAEVCATGMGGDSVRRLSLKFLDAEPPDRLLNAR